MNYDVIYNSSTDPYFNLASEQYLLDRDRGGPVFMLWRNSPAVIIGRYQNAYAEINEPFVRERDIAVVRRLTGGGAVFHDLGNLNYSFVSKNDSSNTLDFARFCEPIIKVLCQLGADARLSGRNDIEVGGIKVSGNAQCVRGDNLLHHGTLLWSADLSALGGALRVDPQKIAAKGIKSVRSRVANLSDILGSGMTVLEFAELILSSLGGRARGFTEHEIAEIEALQSERYSRWEWNWGESKQLSACRKRRFDFGRLELSFDASRGVIERLEISGDFFAVGDVEALARSLVGVRLESSALLAAFSTFGPVISGAKPEDFVDLLLSAQ